MAKSDIEKEFHDEIRDKKRTGSGVYSKTGSRGYVGTMRFPSDIMSRKDKRAYRKNSKVVIKTMAEITVLNYEQFKALAVSEQKKLMEEYRAKFTNTQIQEAMGISHNTFGKLLNSVGVEKKQRGGTRKGAGGKKKKGAVEEVPAVQLPDLGWNTTVRGNFGQEEAKSKLERLAMLLEEEKNYEIVVTVKEIG